jgi:hypothetical protein
MAAIAPTATTETATAMDAGFAVVNNPFRTWLPMSDIATTHKMTTEKIAQNRNEYRRKPCGVPWLREVPEARVFLASIGLLVGLLSSRLVCRGLPGLRRHGFLRDRFFLGSPTASPPLELLADRVHMPSKWGRRPVFADGRTGAVVLLT